jgi:hypothetical protein
LNPLTPGPIISVLMVEIEQQNPWAETDRTAAELTNYMMGAEFGSSKFQAFQDIHCRSEAYERWITATAEVAKNIGREISPEQSVRVESNLRIIEVQRALLERQIETHRTHLPGYTKAFSEITSFLSSIGTVCYDEAARQAGEDEKRTSGLFESKTQQIRDSVKALLDEQSE